MLLKKTESYSPWHNSAEGGIKDLKIGAGRKMLKYWSKIDCVIIVWNLSHMYALIY